jgi:hypoxanthine phosphoribosyltransferase
MSTETDTAGVPAEHGRNEDGPRFAHASERVAAEILDFYGVAWEYEPTSFPLEWDAKGNVISWFTPDFYLPDFDLYIELTTMSQKLVTKKNRKVRRLKELHPEINVKVLYQKDFRRLLQRFGIAPVDIPHSEGGGVVSAAHEGDELRDRIADYAPEPELAEAVDDDPEPRTESDDS